MKLQRPLLLALLLILAAVVVGVWAFRLLPPDAVIPTHSGLRGEVHGSVAKGPALAAVPIFGAVIVLVLAFIPRFAPSTLGLNDPRGPYGVVLIGVAAMFLVVEAALAMRMLDPAFEVLRWVVLAAGVFFAVIGNLLGKMRPNSLMGVRTPWTLRDPRVWDKTHRFTGRLTVLAGVALAAVAFLRADHTDLVVALIVCAGAPAIAGVLYSRAISQAEPAKG